MFKSVVHILLESIEKFGDKPIILHKKNGEYTAISYREFGETVRTLSHGLAAWGLQPGDRIAILSDNRPEWPQVDFAIFSLRGITVPIYQTLPPNQIAYILKDAGIRAIFLDSELQYRKIAEIRDTVPNLEYVFSFEKLEVNDKTVFPYHQLLTAGETHRQEHPDFFTQSVEAIDPTETCSLVYTSGTTGNPKGVMLHHRGFVVDIVNSERVLNLFPEDVFLSFLPLSHLYERLAGHWCAIYRGCTIGYAENLNTVIDDIQLVRPTVMVSVPRLYEKISTRVIDQVESGSALKRMLFFWALKTGQDYHTKKHQQKLNRLTSFKYHLADRLVFRKIKQRLGGRFRCPISGGAPLPVQTLKFFEAMGLPIIEGYGMTETHLIITLTPPGKIHYGSCGKPIPGVEVKIAEDGEILVRGETLMKGYYNKPELTREVIDEDGWLHTGDIGYLDEENFLYITDRKKNILVTAGGKNVAPAPIEHALKQSRYIEDVCLVGDRRKFISAVIVPDYENLKQWARENGLPEMNQEELVQHERIKLLIGEEIERLQADFARFEKVKKFVLLPEPLSVEKGELTPSLKIKRNVVEEHYKHLIDPLYRD